MSESTPSSTNSSGTKESETSPEESESESPERELKKKEKAANGTHSFNISILMISQEDSLKKLKSPHDLII